MIINSDMEGQHTLYGGLDQSTWIKGMVVVRVARGCVRGYAWARVDGVVSRFEEG